MATTFTTTKSRKLEQFLYAHGIDFISQDKDDEGMTIWTYEQTDEVMFIITEFKIALERRMKKGA